MTVIVMHLEREVERTVSSMTQSQQIDEQFKKMAEAAEFGEDDLRVGRKISKMLSLSMGPQGEVPPFRLTMHISLTEEEYVTMGRPTVGDRMGSVLGKELVGSTRGIPGKFVKRLKPEKLDGDRDQHP